MTEIVKTSLGQFSYPGQGHVVRAEIGSHQATLSLYGGSGSISASVSVMGSNDQKGWVLITAMSVSSDGGVGSTRAVWEMDYLFWRLDVDSISSGCTVDCTVISDQATASISTIALLANSAIVPADTTISELRRACEAAAREGRRFHVPRADIGLSEPWTIDVSKVDCDFQNSIFTSTHSGNALGFIGRSNPTYWNSKNGVRSFALVGPGESIASSVGILTGDTEYEVGGVSGPNRVRVQDYVITEFGEGVRHGSRSYGERFERGAIFNCGYGVRMPDLAEDAGEATTYEKNFIFQCANWGVSIEGTHGTWMNFNDCHHDHNQRQFNVSGRAHVSVNGGHVEALDYTQGAPIVVSGDGACYRQNGGQFVMTKDGTRACQYIVDNSVPVGFGGAYFSSNVYWYKVWTKTGYFATGAGFTDTGGFITSSDSRGQHCLFLNSSFNVLIDGGFERTDWPDEWQIYSDTAAITSPRTGANIQLSRETVASGRSPRSGSAFLQANKVNGAGSNAKFLVKVKINNPMKRGMFRLYMRKTATGSVTVTPVWAAMRAGSVAGVYAPVNTFGTESAITFSDTTGDWVEVKSRGNAIKPALPYQWATDYVLLIDCNNMGQGVLDIDDAEIHYI